VSGPLDEARERLRDATRERLQEAQERLAETQELAREAQERAVLQAREAAAAAQERARLLAEAMPPGLLPRLASSFVGIAILLSFVFIEVSPRLPGLLFTFAMSIIALIGAGEYFRGVRLRGFRPSEALAFFAVVVLQFAAWNVSRGQLLAVLPALLAVLAIATLVHQVLRREPEPLAGMGVTFVGVIYVGWLISYVIWLRSLPGITTVWPFPPASLGAWLVLYVCATTWSADAGAYFVGARYGRRKLAPTLSPKKTVEGAVGGLLASSLMSIAWGSWVHLPLIHCLVLGPVIGMLAQVGDLCESAIKRDLGIKDFGGIMPGHGGVLDRFDSVLFTAPIAYYYLVLVIHPL
jgi:phosphatidate cytidylyltransferase